jgi:hypothetical protein
VRLLCYNLFNNSYQFPMVTLDNSLLQTPLYFTDCLAVLNSIRLVDSCRVDNFPMTFLRRLGVTHSYRVVRLGGRTPIDCIAADLRQAHIYNREVPLELFGMGSAIGPTSLDARVGMCHLGTRHRLLEVILLLSLLFQSRFL